uniref:PDZ domain-containing protein n=1 Tax=Parascaris univalens TaxID=6257 RepID=A0A915AUJ9_PARUN
MNLECNAFSSKAFTFSLFHETQNFLQLVIDINFSALHTHFMSFCNLHLQNGLGQYSISPQLYIYIVYIYIIYIHCIHTLHIHIYTHIHYIYIHIQLSV